MGKQRTYAFAYNDRGAWKDQLTKVTYTGYNALKYRGYYYDADFGLYYLSSRYFDPVICRFINADNSVAGAGGAMLGCNMYAYCFNNPVNMDDNGGNWPKWMKNVSKKVKSVVKKSVGILKKAKGKITNIVKKFSNYIKKNVGLSINTGKEFAITKSNFLVGSYEAGTGYDKSFSNGKSTNLYLTVPDDPFSLKDYEGGIDMNVEGYGYSIQYGAEQALGIHMKNNSYEIGLDSLGGLYYKHTYSVDDGYLYSRYSVNIPTVALTVVGAVYCPNIVAGVASSVVVLY